MKLIYAKDYDSMSAIAATLIANEVYTNPTCVLGLATGSTPVGTYKELIRMHKNNDLDFSKVNTVNLDEYKGLTKDNDQSYAYFMYENLFKHVNIDMEKTNIPNGLNEDIEDECNRYEAVIDSLGGVDIQLLGIGQNGHIGFNEPDKVFVSKTHAIELTQNTIEANARFFNSIDEVPTVAYTMGNRQIMNAKTVVLVANGANKAQAIYDLVAGDANPMSPASILQFHQNAYIICDEAALSLVAQKAPELLK